MKKSWLLNAALLLLVVALGWFAYNKPRRDEPTSYPLSTLKPDKIRQIRLERSSGPPIRLERKQDLWLITAPFTAHADPFHVERLLAIVAARAAHRFAGTDLARFELEQPQARLTIDGQSFNFGTVSAVTREQYVLTGGTVYAIDPRYGGALPANAEQLVRRQLFAGNEAPVRFEFKDFTITQSDGRWSVTPTPADGGAVPATFSGRCDPGAGNGARTTSAGATRACAVASPDAGAPAPRSSAPADLSQDDFNRWVDEWRQAAALRAEHHADKKTLGEIKVVFKDGRKLTLGILQREPELIISRPDEKVRYYFPSETARRLLTPPGPRNQ